MRRAAWVSSTMSVMAGAEVSSANALVATTVMAISASAKRFRESSVVIAGPPVR